MVLCLFGIFALLGQDPSSLLGLAGHGTVAFCLSPSSLPYAPSHCTHTLPCPSLACHTCPCLPHTCIPACPLHTSFYPYLPIRQFLFAFGTYPSPFLSPSFILYMHRMPCSQQTSYLPDNASPLCLAMYARNSILHTAPVLQWVGVKEASNCPSIKVTPVIIIIQWWC